MSTPDDCACADMGRDVCPACERAIACVEDARRDRDEAAARDFAAVADRYLAQFGWGRGQ